MTDDWSWLRRNHFLQAGITLLLGTERHWASPTEVEGHFTFNGYATGNAMPDYLLGLASDYAQNSAGLRTIAHYKIISPVRRGHLACSPPPHDLRRLALLVHALAE